MSRTRATLLCLALPACLAGCGPALPSASQPDGTPPAAPRESPAKPSAPAPKVLRVAEGVRVGDLLVKLEGLHSTTVGAGEFRGRFTPARFAFAHFSAKNVSETKIADWKGTHGRASLKDAHGNAFNPMSLSDWSRLPNNGEPWDGHELTGDDRDVRVQPGETYHNAAYFEYVPPSSREFVLSVTVNGTPLEFRGAVTHHKP